MSDKTWRDPAQSTAIIATRTRFRSQTSIAVRGFYERNSRVRRHSLAAPCCIVKYALFKLSTDIHFHGVLVLGCPIWRNAVTLIIRLSRFWTKFYILCIYLLFYRSLLLLLLWSWLYFIVRNGDKVKMIFRILWLKTYDEKVSGSNTVYYKEQSHRVNSTCFTV